MYRKIQGELNYDKNSGTLKWRPMYQNSETNVTNFLFNLVRIKDLRMFRALFAHLQEALHN
jgi:hypothetical protein